VTEEDFSRVWQSIRDTLTADYLEHLNVAATKASKLRYEQAPPAKIAGAMFDGFVEALVRIGPDVRTQLVILAIIERHLKRVFLDSADPLDFDGASRAEHKADALETSGGWALETALSQRLGERGLKLKPANLAQQCAASLPNIRREWEVIVREKGWFLRFQQPTPVEGPRSRTHLPEAAHFAAAAVLLEFEQLRQERGVTEYDVLDERYPDLEGAHLKTMGKAAEILYTARCNAAAAQFGEGSLSTLADPIAEDVVDDLCRLPLPIKPFLDLERSRRSAPDNEPDLRFDLRLLTRGALAGNQQFRNVVRQWTEPTLSRLVAKNRSTVASETGDPVTLKNRTEKALLKAATVRPRNAGPGSRTPADKKNLEVRVSELHDQELENRQICEALDREKLSPVLIKSRTGWELKAKTFVGLYDYPPARDRNVSQRLLQWFAKVVKRSRTS
jgi:hypothetical protein